MKKTLTGLVLCLTATVLIGCGESTTYESYDEAATSDGSHGGHGHAHEHGPHDGHVLELASDHSVHGELCLDEGGKSMTFYVLGPDLKTPLPAESIEFEIDKDDDEVELPATAMPLDGEEDGKSSRFSIDSSMLGELTDLESVHAHVHVMIDGEEFKGALEHNHGDEGHAHGDHEEHGEHGHKEGDGHDHDEAGHHDDKDGHGHDDDKDHKHEDGDHDEKHEHDKDGK